MSKELKKVIIYRIQKVATITIFNLGARGKETYIK